MIVFMVDGTTLDTQGSTGAILDQINNQVTESRLWENGPENPEMPQHIDSIASEDSLHNDFSEERELIVVINKTDLLENEARGKLPNAVMSCSKDNSSVQEDKNGKGMVFMPMSCKTEHGLDDFLELFSKKVANM